ncbi:MAG: Trigger factor [Parcubacteria group bacterium LiPW_39]|nr:MAG: Trigger factor [Parcubacteria group bacterium LiPW_39]
MKTEIKNLPQSEIEINFELDLREWGEFIDEARKELSNNLKINGFRPGHAPKELAEKEIGLGKILEKAADAAVKKTYVDLITGKSIEAIGAPEIQVLKAPAPYRTEGSGAGAADNPFEFKAKVAVMPEVKLGDYQKIAKKTKPKKREEIKVEEKEVDEAVKWLQKSRTKYISVNRPARQGDLVEIDFKAKENGQIIEGGESQNHPLILGGGRFVPGFEENLVGLKENEEKKFVLAFPVDFKLPDLAGKTLDFEVKINLVQESQPPELNDDFAKSLGDFSNLAVLQVSVREGLVAEKEQREKEVWRAEILQDIVKNSQVVPPEILIKAELEKMIQEFKASLAEMGLEMEIYLQNIKKTLPELKEEWLPKAKERVRSALVLREIARLEKIDISPAEVEEEINKILARYSDAETIKNQIDIEQLMEYTKGRLKNEKVFQFLENS